MFLSYRVVYADFVMGASSLLLNAYTRDEISLSGDEQRLIGLINRMRLFAPPDVVEGAEAGKGGTSGMGSSLIARPQ